MVVGWERTRPPRAFLWSTDRGLQYLDELYPAVRTLSLMPDPNQQPTGTQGYRINRHQEVLLRGALAPGLPNHQGFYRLSSNGVVSPLVLTETQGLDLNNHGELPPPGPPGSDTLVLNDRGDHAGIVVNAQGTTIVGATRNGRLLPNSAGTRPTAINNLGQVAAWPGLVWGPDDGRTDIRAALAAQDPNRRLPGFYPNGVNGMSDTFINDAGDIVWANLFLQPVCPEISIAVALGAGFEVAGTQLSVQVGVRFKATVTVRNIGRVPLHDMSVVLSPAPQNFHLLAGPSPTIPGVLAPGEEFAATFEWEAFADGTYVGGFAVLGRSDCGPFEQGIPPATIRFETPPLEARIAVAPETVGLDEEIEVRTTATNHTSGLATEVHFDAPLAVLGDGGVRLLTGPSPAGIARLNPGESVTFTNRYLATNFGRFRFTGTVVGTQEGLPLVSNPATSADVRIQILGDLLIRGAHQSAARRAADDVYEETPSAAQMRTNHVSLGALSNFEVLVQNDNATPHTFRIRAAESGTNGWWVSYRMGDRDVSEDVRSAEGFELAPLSPGRFHTLAVAAVQTDLEAGRVQRSLLTLTSPRQPGVTLDAVEAASQAAFRIVVNSDADLPDEDPEDCCCDTGRLFADGTPECTLRAAIQTANHLDGVEWISFGLKDANERLLPSATISPESVLPAITGPVLLDGYSQNPESPLPPVELTGIRIPAPGSLSTNPDALADWHGLSVQADGCVIMGMAISWFPDFGIHLAGDENTVLRCFVGTDLTGEFSQANGVTSDDPENFTTGGGILVEGRGNQIGDAGLGNVISGADTGYRTVVTYGVPSEGQEVAALYSGPGIWLRPGADETRIQGNLIGPSRSGEKVTAQAGGGLWVGVLVESDDNLIGGLPGEVPLGNRIGNCLVGVSLLGRSNAVLGNGIGISDGGLNLGNVVGIGLGGEGNRIGEREAGNLLVFNQWGVRAVDAWRFQISGNQIGFDEESDGGTSSSHQYVGIEVVGRGTESFVSDNVIADHLFEGIRVGGDGRPVHGLVAVDNRIFYNGRAGAPPSRMAGIHIASGTGNALFRNEIFNNTGRAISLLGAEDPEGLAGDVNDEGDADTGPNTLLNYPVLRRATLGDGETRLEGYLDMAPVAWTYRLEFYASDNGYSDARRYLGHAEFPTDASGHVDIVAHLEGPVTPGEYVTSLAVDPSGNTSQVSNAVLAQGPEDSEQDGVSDDVESLVPASAEAPLSAGAVASPQSQLQGRGDGNGDGIPDALQSNVVSFPGVAGIWFTLSAGEGVAFRDVVPMDPRRLGAVPPGYALSFGAVAFSLTGVSSGGSVMLTNRIHDTTHWEALLALVVPAGETQPRWVELGGGPPPAPGGPGWSLSDGGIGDRDGRADGRITVVLAPGVKVVASPGLSLVHTTEASATKVELSGAPGSHRALVTNQISLITSVLSWPASESGWWVQSTEALSPTNFWRTVQASPVLHDDRFLLTNRFFDAMRAFRLWRDDARRRP